jgi:uncharacterized membrane protein
MPRAAYNHHTAWSAGLAFGLLELLLDVLLKGFLKRRFKASMSKPDDQEAEINATLAITRVVGFAHNSVQVVLGLAVLLDPTMRGDTIRATTGASQAVMLLAAGYFTWDVVICAKRVREEGWQYLLHAVLCCLGYSSAWSYGVLQYYGGSPGCCQRPSGALAGPGSAQHRPEGAVEGAAAR